MKNRFKVFPLTRITELDFAGKYRTGNTAILQPIPSTCNAQEQGHQDHYFELLSLASCLLAGSEGQAYRVPILKRRRVIKATKQ